jgi:hypothetical protein
MLIDPFTPVETTDPEAEEAMRNLGREAARRVNEEVARQITVPAPPQASIPLPAGACRMISIPALGLSVVSNLSTLNSDSFMIVLWCFCGGFSNRCFCTATIQPRR